jgi:predicted Rossmann fold flavoprotein
MTDTFDAIIIGAGAAGLMCALSAGQRGRRVVLIDHGREAGAKILISGGGRCNFTNSGTSPANFLSANPAFCRSALSRYTPSDFLSLVEKHKIAWHEKTLGQLFCDGSARQIVAMLLAECQAAGVSLVLNAPVTSVNKSEQFQISAGGRAFTAPSLVLATGGLSIPKMGASGFAHDVARQFGLAVVPPRPALVPLKAAAASLDLCRSLAGVALPVVTRAGAMRFAEAMLFTHRGLSGPAVLQVSSYLSGDASFAVDLLPQRDAERFLKDRKHEKPRLEVKTVLAEVLPARLAAALAPGGRMDALSRENLDALARQLKHWTIPLAGDEGYAKAEVTAGGIDTDELSSKTMEARRVPGLYAIGEAVDVTGWLGGYNFQWAWASGWCAGQALA